MTNSESYYYWNSNQIQVGYDKKGFYWDLLLNISEMNLPEVLDAWTKLATPFLELKMLDDDSTYAFDGSLNYKASFFLQLCNF